MVDVRERSFDAAANASKLLITLSTGALAIGLAVLNTEVGKATALTPVSPPHKYAIAGALVVLLVSLGIGFWTQLALTHVLADSARNNTSPDVWDRRITLPFQGQISTFLLGVVAFVVYGLVRITA